MATRSNTVSNSHAPSCWAFVMASSQREEPADSRLQGGANLRIFQRVVDQGLQVIDGVTNGQPFAIGNGLRDDAASTAYVFANRVCQPQLIRFAQGNFAQNPDHISRKQETPEHGQI